MGFIVLLLFIGIPIVEISVFIQVGDIIGLWPTIAIVILTALIGTTLLRQQGLSTLMRAQNTLNEGNVPAAELFDGVCLLLAGAFLLTPGFVTDSLGLLLFLPPFRALIRNNVINFVIKNAKIHVVNADGQPQQPHAHKKPNDSTIIDADFEDVTPDPDSPWIDKKD
ncbi:MAG: FxsA family protein [Methylocystaceae bacterium]|nr:FxsA family protein [Methylocystaceae bacterium]